MELVWMRAKESKAANQFRYLWLAVVVILADQALKIIVKLNLPLYQSKQVLGNLIMLTHVQNTGAAFSLSLGDPNLNRWFFIIMTIFALAFVVYLMYKSTNRLQQISLSLIIGGALGNLLDRILFGYVTDFIDVDFPDFIMQRWPIFNLADSSVFIALCLLILDLIIHRDKVEDKHAAAQLNKNINQE
ncbi:MAG TPA: signal peptidase II [Candidatus Cloacimonadota bacterium]|nr:signal peptidase II [Candidatus Cloacimonadota bacterium]HOV17134.1 signal peptidase II [Candidatus Cloacimonadota bacterium]HQL15412.1 signal peptidase II [Candidatus Cloacimonadota bacterium]